MVHFTSDEEIERIGRGLRDRTLPKAEWTHAAHFGAAFWLLRDRGAAALSEMPLLIRAYNEATGVPNTDTSGYHETITIASLRLARAWLAERFAMKTYSALNGLLTSEFGRSEWPLAYWSAELLFSVRARRAWVEPDRQPLPF